MILTPLAADRLETTLTVFAESLPTGFVRGVFKRIAPAADGARADGKKSLNNHSESIDLIAKFCIGTKPGAPQLDVSWDGSVLRSGTEASGADGLGTADGAPIARAAAMHTLWHQATGRPHVGARPDV